MAVEQNILKARRWFTGENKQLKFKGFGEDGVTPMDMTGMNFRFVLADDPEGAIELTKESPAGISVIGVFDEDPDLNTQAVEVSIVPADTAALFKGRHYYSLVRIDPGFVGVVAFGYWEAEKVAGL